MVRRLVRNVGTKPTDIPEIEDPTEWLKRMYLTEMQRDVIDTLSNSDFYQSNLRTRQERKAAIDDRINAASTRCSQLLELWKDTVGWYRQREITHRTILLQEGTQ